MEPEISDELLNLHMYFDSDYANEFSGWASHATVCRHSEPREIELSEEITPRLNLLSNPKIVGIEQKKALPLTGYKKRFTGSPMNRELQDHIGLNNAVERTL